MHYRYPYAGPDDPWRSRAEAEAAILAPILVLFVLGLVWLVFYGPAVIGVALVRP